MNEETFWQLIDRTRQASGGDIVLQCNLLVSALERMPVPDIFGYEDIYVRLVHAAFDERLWAAGCIMDDLSDDGFLDFRSWLISRGKTAYTECVKDPESLVNYATRGERVTAEEMNSVAARAYQLKTGTGSFVDSYVPKQECPEIKDASFDWKTAEGYPDQDRLRLIFPKLFSTFGGR